MNMNNNKNVIDQKTITGSQVDEVWKVHNEPWGLQTEDNGKLTDRIISCENPETTERRENTRIL